jgi:hypothetical protein
VDHSVAPSCLPHDVPGRRNVVAPRSTRDREGEANPCAGDPRGSRGGHVLKVSNAWEGGAPAALGPTGADGCASDKFQNITPNSSDSLLLTPNPKAF